MNDNLGVSRKDRKHLAKAVRRVTGEPSTGELIARLLGFTVGIAAIMAVYVAIIVGCVWLVAAMLRAIF